MQIIAQKTTAATNRIIQRITVLHLDQNFRKSTYSS